MGHAAGAMEYGLHLLESADAPELEEDLEIFQTSCGRGLRAAKTFGPGDVVLADRAILPPCAHADDFATAATAEWTNFSQKDQHKLMSLHWRSQSSSSNGYGSSSHCPSGRLDVAWPGVSGKAPVPVLPRLRGIAALNGMAIAKLMMKPSSLKTLEAVPRNGLAVYLNGSLLNHSCCPTVNRLPYESCLVARAQRLLVPGDELTCAYIEVRAPHFIRQAELDSTWAFECRCWRCCLEHRLWSAAPQAERALRSAWRRFERWRKSGNCEEEELRELVSSTAEFTKTCLSEFLAQRKSESDWLVEGLEDGMLKRYNDALQCSSDDVMALDPLNLSSAKEPALVAFFKLLLSSYWVAPAFELAFGLQESQRYQEALEHWLAVRDVTGELMPLSPSHSAAATEAALSAVAAGVQFEEILEESVRISCGTYGVGSWLRLAAGRLERFEDSTRRRLQALVGRCEDQLGQLVQDVAVPEIALQMAGACGGELDWYEPLRQGPESDYMPDSCGSDAEKAWYLPARREELGELEPGPMCHTQRLVDVSESSPVVTGCV
eukprot:symbB.v1.2.033895.t1/scaffold4279.1/size42069/2